MSDCAAGGGMGGRMDRQGQAADGKFEGGIFSGTVESAVDKEQEDQHLQENRYFDNASDYMHRQEIPLEGSPAGEEIRKEEADRPGGTELHGEAESPDETRVREETKRPEEPANACHSRRERGSCCCRNCPDRQKQGQTVLFIISVTAVAALAVALLIAVFGLVIVSLWKPGQPSGNNGNMADSKKEADFESNASEDAGFPKGDKYGKIPAPGAAGSGEYYGEIADAIRTDLDYSIRWENYEFEGNNDDVAIAVDYPVIEGNVPNLEAINDIIDDETEYFEEYYKEYSKYMMPEESFFVYSEGFVTFMDPEVMSVVFCEMIYTDYWAEYGLYCLNIDVENGVVLDNNSIMNIDDEFAVDFRKRCRQQNGTVNDLDSMTDQEIVYYLTSGGTSIVFYTPLGMEVGLNMGEYYVTVTYRDYEEFLQKY